MHSNPDYTLWFVNQSLRSGKVCLYHDPANAACNQLDVRQRAWRVAGANPGVVVCFEWSLDYSFVWLDEGEAASSCQFASAEPGPGSAVILTHTPFGHEFRPRSESAPRGQLLVQGDRSLIATAPPCVGLGMDGGAILTVTAGPNITTVFTPAREAQLSYWITFGAYGLRANAALQPTLLNPPARIRFPDQVYTMTATLNTQNEWTVSAGEPSPSQFRQNQP
jgi:hypothetical protein